jgi:hypothetical protein
MNPAHLEAVTPRVSILRGECSAAKNARKEVCIRGHELHFDPKRNSRRCKICARERWLRLNPPKPAVERQQCDRGHSYRGDERISSGGRVCRECSRLKTAAYRQRLKMASS